MTAQARLDVTERWGTLNDGLIALVDVIPDDKFDWSPREELWDRRHILAHVCMTRHDWMGNRISQKISNDDMWASVQTNGGLKEQLRRSWARVERFLSDQANLDRVFEGEAAGEAYSFTGQWIAFHLLEHDIHHRADVFHYLALLGVSHPEVETP